MKILIVQHGKTCDILHLIYSVQSNVVHLLIQLVKTKLFRKDPGFVLYGSNLGQNSFFIKLIKKIFFNKNYKNNYCLIFVM